MSLLFLYICCPSWLHFFNSFLYLEGQCTQWLLFVSLLWFSKPFFICFLVLLQILDPFILFLNAHLQIPFYFLIFYTFHEKYFSSCIYKVFEITYVLDYMEILLTFDIGWHLQDGNRSLLLLRGRTRLRNLMNTYCHRQAVELNAIRFLYNGRQLTGDETPDEVCFFALYSYFPSRYNIGGVKNSFFVHCVSKLIFWCMLLMAIA